MLDTQQVGPLVVGAHDVNDLRLATAFALHFLATPFCLSSLHSLASLRVMAAAFPDFAFFFPVISADFLSYALALKRPA